MFIFDVDGVLTNPAKKRITKPQIIDFIKGRLRTGNLIALNTGRSLSWTANRIINRFFEKTDDKKILKNFFVIGEKGGTWLTFDKNGNMKQFKDESISVPKFLQNQVRALITAKYSNLMFFDDSKLTMISIEMAEGVSIDQYNKAQGKLEQELKNLLSETNLDQTLKIELSIIAIDIENRYVGKDFAVKRMLLCLKEKGLSPKKYVAFGDSVSDISMAEELHKANLSFEFVFVGDRKLIAGKRLPFPTTLTDKLFDEGTAEYLEKIKQHER